MLPKLCLLALALRRAEEKAKDLPWLPYNHSSPYADEYEAMVRGVLEAMRPDGEISTMGAMLWRTGIDAILTEYDDYMRRDIHGNLCP